MHEKRRKERDWSRNCAENFGRASIALVSEYKGVKAGESDDMRRRIRAVNGEFRVAKNTLLRLAIKDTSFAALESQLGGPVGLILSYADPVELAKTVSSFKELGEKFKIRGGVLDGKPLTAGGSRRARVAAAARSDLCAVAGPVAGAGDSAGAAAQRARLVVWRGCSTRSSKKRAGAAPCGSSASRAAADGGVHLASAWNGSSVAA